MVVDEELVLQAVRAEAKARASDGKGEETESKVYDLPALSELLMLRLSFKSTLPRVCGALSPCGVDGKHR